MYQIQPALLSAIYDGSEVSFASAFNLPWFLLPAGARLSVVHVTGRLFSGTAKCDQCHVHQLRMQVDVLSPLLLFARSIAQLVVVLNLIRSKQCHA